MARSVPRNWKTAKERERIWRVDTCNGWWAILTSPGCGHQDHHAEVGGAAMAIDVRGNVAWSDITDMDCGCRLRVSRVTDIDPRNEHFDCQGHQ
jgi:hypothetical protein